MECHFPRNALYCAHSEDVNKLFIIKFENISYKGIGVEDSVLVKVTVPVVKREAKPLVKTKSKKK